jgi:hypothetical protein
VEALSKAMAGLRGRRKALLLFSEGIDFDTDAVRPQMGLMFDSATDAPAVIQAEQDMMAAATRANVSIYTIDPKGLSTGAEELVKIASMAAGNTVPIGDMAIETMRERSTLRQYAEQTGGFAALESNDFNTMFDRIVRDNSSYYVLGYHAPEKADGKFHAVTVRVKRPGLQVRTRDGYFAAAKTPSQSGALTDPVREALSSPAQVGGLGMHIGASVLKDVGGQDTVHLTVEFSGRDLSFTRDALTGTFANQIDVEYQALNDFGQPAVDSRQTVQLHLREQTRAAVPQHGVRFLTEFDVPPGRYQIRVGAHEAVSGHTGTVFYDLEAPDFSSTPLAVSDVLIALASTDFAAIGGLAPRATMLSPAPTTAGREWTSDDTIVASAEIYDNDTHPHTVDVSTVVRADDGTQVFSTEEPRTSQGIGGKIASVFKSAVKVPLKLLAPGRYVLTLVATSRLDGQTVTKDVEFRVK